MALVCPGTLTDKARKRIIKSRGVFHHCCLIFAGATEARLFPISALKSPVGKAFRRQQPTSVSQSAADVELLSETSSKVY